MILDWKLEEKTLLNIKNIIAITWRMNGTQLFTYYEKLKKNRIKILPGRLGSAFLQKLEWITKQDANETAKIWLLLMKEIDQLLKLIRKCGMQEQKAWIIVLKNLEAQQGRYFKTEMGMAFILVLKEKLASTMQEQRQMSSTSIFEQKYFFPVCVEEKYEQDKIVRWLMEDTYMQRAKQERKKPYLMQRQLRKVAVWFFSFLSVCFMAVWLHGQIGRNLDRWSLQQMKASATGKGAILLEKSQKTAGGGVLISPMKQRKETAQIKKEEKIQAEQHKGPKQEKLPQYRKMSKEYPQLYGWLQIPDTQINLPVMRVQGDRDFYLNHDFSGAESTEGTLFVDEKNSIYPQDGNTVIYGHNMKNGHMFGTLKLYMDEDFFQTHRKICFDTIYEAGTYNVVTVLKTRILNKNEPGFRYYQFFQYQNKKEFQECKDFVEENQMYHTDSSLQYGDKILMLSTCEYSQENGRLVVVAKKISD